MSDESATTTEQSDSAVFQYVSGSDIILVASFASSIVIHQTDYSVFAPLVLVAGTMLWLTLTGAAPRRF
jgi:hypothetical protein